MLFFSEAKRVTRLTSVLLASCLQIVWANALASPEVESLFGPSIYHSDPKETVSKVEADPGSARGAQHKDLMWYQKVESLQQEVQELRGRIEEQQYALEQLSKHQRELYLDLDRRLREGGLAKLGMLPEVKPVPDPAVGHFNFDVGVPALPERPSLALAEQDTEDGMYQKAYALIQGHEYQSAQHALEQLIAAYPDGKTLPNTYYWLGEIQLTQGAFNQAAGYFQTILERYPLHQKTASALYKLGVVAYERDQFQEAEKLFNQVKAKFPNTTTARLADLQLKQLKKLEYPPKHHS